MTPLIALAPAFAAAIALFAATLLVGEERRREGVLVALTPVALLTPLAWTLAAYHTFTAGWAALIVALVIAILAREGDDPLQSECALKLLWVIGVALALSWAGDALLALAAGTSRRDEQWGVLALGVDPQYLWSVALPLSLLAGLVLLGGAPFHFWIADLLQGAPAWLAPLAGGALQLSGAAWLMLRLEGIEKLPAGAAIASGLIAVAAGIAFLGGGATLPGQRRPERRMGTLASLQGALVLGALATRQRAGGGRPMDEVWFAVWAAHLALALTGAGLLSRFLPVSTAEPARAATLFRRHKVSAIVGLYSLLSLAGVPGTPGSWVWLQVARRLAADNARVLLIAMAVAWLAAITVALRQSREAFGVADPSPPPASTVPWPARAALWVPAAGLVALAWLVWPLVEAPR